MRLMFTMQQAWSADTKDGANSSQATRIMRTQARRGSQNEKEDLLNISLCPPPLLPSNLPQSFPHSRCAIVSGTLEHDPSTGSFLVPNIGTISWSSVTSPLPALSFLPMLTTPVQSVPPVELQLASSGDAR